VSDTLTLTLLVFLPSFPSLPRELPVNWLTPPPPATPSSRRWVCLGACVLLRVCVSTKGTLFLRSSGGLCSSQCRQARPRGTTRSRLAPCVVVERALSRRSPYISSSSLPCTSYSLFVLLLITSSMFDFYSVMRG